MGKTAPSKGQKKATHPYAAPTKDKAMATLMSKIGEDPEALKALIAISFEHPNLSHEADDDDDDENHEENSPSDLDDHDPSLTHTLSSLQDQLRSTQDQIIAADKHILEHQDFISNLPAIHHAAAKANLKEQINLKNLLTQSASNLQARILAIQAEPPVASGKGSKKPKSSKSKPSDDDLPSIDPREAAYRQKMEFLTLLASKGYTEPPSTTEQTLAQPSSSKKDNALLALSRMSTPSAVPNPWNVFAGFADQPAFLNPPSHHPPNSTKNPSSPSAEADANPRHKIKIKRPKASPSISGIAAHDASTSSSTSKRSTRNSRKAANAAIAAADAVATPAVAIAEPVDDSSIANSIDHATPSTLTAGEPQAPNHTSESPISFTDFL